MEHGFSLLFTFSNVYSIDASVEKDMALLQLEIANANQEQAAYLQEQQALQTQLNAASQNRCCQQWPTVLPGKAFYFPLMAMDSFAGLLL